MKKSQKLLVEQSEKRERINELLELDEITDEHRTELDGLTKRMAGIEIELRAAITAEGVDEPSVGDMNGTVLDAEDRERAELRGKVRFRNYLEASVEQRAAVGAEAEFNAAIGLPGNRFPLELLAPVEKRATTAVDGQANQSGRWIDRLFAGTAADRIGITMESVAPGVASYPVTTAGASAAQRGKEENAADAAWTVGVTEMKPKRNSVRALFTMEDAMRLPGLEGALTRDLRMAIVEGIDRAVFIGDAGGTGTDADITGLTTAAITESTITQANKVMGEETLAAFTGMVDGIAANSLMDLNVVSAVGAWRLWENTIVSNADNQTVAAFLRAAGLTWSARGQHRDQHRQW